jgi:K+-sensing histidine kinase KdpD
MKSSLISTASHELRTPLAVIKGYATTLLAKDVNWDRDAQLEFLEAISTETDRINDLVNNLLDMSRIEAGNLELKYLAATPEELIENAILRTFPRPDVPIQVQIDPKLPFLSVDATRIEVVLQNLLENAVKYAGPHARIIVRAKRVGECVEFQVEDDGPGIPIGEQEYVFTSFYRVESENIRNISGVGLGLSICRGFVDAHGGKIWINGDRPGTCIVFQLPVDPQSPLALKEQTPVEQPR